MRRTPLPLVLGAACAAVVAASPAAAADVTTRRLAGPDRYATAAEIARATFPDGDANVVLARGDAFADALSAVNVAPAYGNGRGAVLLTPFAGMPATTADAVRALTPHDGTVMGTTEVVSVRAQSQLAETALRVSRVSGRDRYETNLRSYQHAYNVEAQQPALVDGLRTALLVSGVNPADALSTGPVSYGERVPLLLTAPDRLPAATEEALRHDAGGGALQQVVVVGGPGAVSDQVVRELQALGLQVRRLAGADRQQTAVEVFAFAEQEFGWSLDHVNLARGDGFADALAAAPHAGREQAPVLLTGGVDRLSSATRDLLRARAGTITSLDVLGDTTAVSDAVVDEARRAATG